MIGSKHSQKCNTLSLYFCKHPSGRQELLRWLVAYDNAGKIKNKSVNKNDLEML
jgi:hypothetical protein